MLRVDRLRLGAERYYAGLAREDYYLGGGEPPGFWSGGAADFFGLGGNVTKAALERLFKGRGPRKTGAAGTGPHEGEALVQNPDSPRRVAAWDAMYAPPKSASLVWAAGTPSRRQRVQNAHDEAVALSLSLLEAKCGFVRRGQGGIQRVPAKWLVAGFRHGTSRLDDPQLHTHALVINAVVDTGGATGALDANELLLSQKLGGAYYRLALAHLLEEQGFRTEPDPNLNGFFRVVGVPQEASDFYSKRRAEVESKMAELGTSGSEAASEAALLTRGAKTHTARAELFPRWQKELGAKFRLSPARVESLANRSHKPSSTSEIRALLEVSARELTETSNRFTERQFLVYALQNAAGRLHVSPQRLRDEADLFLADRTAIHHFIDQGGNDLYTTDEVIRAEKELVSLLERANNTKPRVPLRQSVVRALHKFKVESWERPLTSDQEAAVWLATGRSRVVTISGFAGTGKSTSLDCIREAFEHSGFRVIGASPTGRAAIELSEASSIPARTLASLTWRLEHRRAPKVSASVVRKGSIAARALKAGLTPLGPTYEHLDRDTVLVVDEVSMMTVADASKLLQLAEDTGCRVILLGDPAQLPAIGHQGAFAEALRVLPTVHMGSVLRQRKLSHRVASELFGMGEVRAALSVYDEEGQLRFGTSMEELIEQLVDEWSLAGGLERPGDHQVIATTRAHVELLNEKLHQARRSAGLLGSLPTMSAVKAAMKRALLPLEERRRIASHLEMMGLGEPPSLYRGDRVLLRENWSTYAFEPVAWVYQNLGLMPKLEKTVAVSNGDLGTVTHVLPGGDFMVRLDRGPTIKLDPSRHPAYQRGYAITAHASQGGSFQNTYNLYSPSFMSREHAYVMQTRHIDQTTLYYAPDYAAAQQSHTALAVQRAQEQAQQHRQQMLQDMQRRMQQEQAQQLAYRIEHRHPAQAPWQSW